MRQDCLIVKASEACLLTLTVFVKKFDKDIVVIESNLRKLQLFLPILYITSNKKEHLFYVVLSKYFKIYISQLKEFFVQKGGGVITLMIPLCLKRWGGGICIPHPP